MGKGIKDNSLSINKWSIVEDSSGRLCFVKDNVSGCLYNPTSVNILTNNYPSLIGTTYSEEPFCLGNRTSGYCSTVQNVPYQLDLPYKKFNDMKALASKRKHKYFAIAGNYGFTFNDIDSSNLFAVANGSPGDYYCTDNTSLRCGCNDQNCTDPLNNGRQWVVYQMY
jgi:hypothetical protein